MQKNMMKLTNGQRRYLALRPIEETWDEVRFNDEITLYFDGDIMRKRITRTLDSYQEVELDRLTSDGRTVLPPLSARGKPKKLNYTALSACSAHGVYFQWEGAYGSIGLGNFTSQHTYYSNEGSGEKLGNWEAVMNWLRGWTDDSTPEDLEDLERFRKSERVRCKIKEGDFFAFKAGRREYGFGRVLMDVRKLQKDIAGR